MTTSTFEELREKARKHHSSTGTVALDGETLQIQIALAELVVEAIDRLRKTIVLSGMAAAATAGFGGTATRLAELAKELELL